jgi:uncharacterized membrane protein YvbJ
MHDKDEWWCDWYLCPNCDTMNIADSFNYCPECGKKIEWIDSRIKTKEEELSEKEMNNILKVVEKTVEKLGCDD